MNKELEEATKQLRAGIVAYVRAAIKATGNAEIAIIMLATTIQKLSEHLTEEDFSGIEEKGGEK